MSFQCCPSSLAPPHTSICKADENMQMPRSSPPWLLGQRHVQNPPHWPAPAVAVSGCYQASREWDLASQPNPCGSLRRKARTRGSFCSTSVAVNRKKIQKVQEGTAAAKLPLPHHSFLKLLQASRERESGISRKSLHDHVEQ